jgi:uncharacterized oxidoreductase
MRMTGNTIFITGGGSGIGQGLARAFHALGNKVIIAGRRKGPLLAMAQTHPGMDFCEIDLRDPLRIAEAADWLVMTHPGVNVLINNAGIMAGDGTGGFMDDDLTRALVETNLLGPIRMTSALVGHLKTHSRAAIVNVTSGLAFAAGPFGGLFGDQGGAAFLDPVAALQAPGRIGARAGAGAAVGADGPDRLARRAARHAAG